MSSNAAAAASQQQQDKCVALKWTNISKVVQVHESSKGLMRRSSISKPQKNSTQTPNTKVILNGVSGMAHPGQVMAIMGPSGSGKTSLLDVLAGRSSYDAGEISIYNSSSTQRSAAATLNGVKHLKRKIAYITQSDSFFGHLTVRDQLTYTALLRLPRSCKEKHTAVQRVIGTFRLEKCADTQIRLISGGEKKRTNIGTQLLTDPLLVILDEPTTGLDSTSAFALLKMLTELSRNQQKTIVTSLHQPSSSMYQIMFDKVLWLAEGCVVYEGSPMDSITYLSTLDYEVPTGYNAADHWMDLLVEDTALQGGTLHRDGSTKVQEQEQLQLQQQQEEEETAKDGSSSNRNLAIENGDNTLYHGDDKEQTSETLSNRRRSFGGWRSSFSSRLLRSSVLEIQLQDNFAELIAKGTSKSVLIEAWRNNEKEDNQQNNNFARNDHHGDEEARPESNNLDQMRDNVIDSSSKSRTRHSSSSTFNTSWLTQFWVLTHRSMKNGRSAIFTLLNIVKSVCLGVMAGLLWFQIPYREEFVEDRASYFFFTMTFWIFDSLFGALFAFPAERSVILKERASGSYHLSAYFMAKTLSEAPVRLALPFMYLVVSYWMASINNSFGVFLATIGINLMSVLAGESIGLLVGATVLDFEKAMALLVVLSVTLMVAGGYYIDNIPSFMVWFQYLSPFTYAYNGSVQLAFNKNVPCDDSKVLEVVCGQPGVKYATPDQVLQFLSVNGTVGFNVALLFVLIIVPRTMAFWALKMKKGGERG